MSHSDDNAADELAGASLELIPFAGPFLAVLGKRMFRQVREEWVRNSSEALRAAERISGLSREDLTDRISEDSRLISLTIRVLYAAGMNGQDVVLKALGASLGHAVRDPEKIDEADLLLAGLSNLRGYHIAVLKIMTKNLTNPTDPDKMLYWTSENLADKSGYSRAHVTICIAGLVQSGLISQVTDAYGVCYEISDLGRTALEALDEFDKEHGGSGALP